MKKILFVDDEPNILEGLRRMLRPLRHEWDMNFASNGQEALRELANRHYDVIVSDMRMPGMDGAQLLAEVRARCPHIVRFVLTGQSDMDSVLRSVTSTHQYLSKPCDPEMLQSAVKRACALRDLLDDESLRRLASGMHALPSLPSLYSDLVREVQLPNASAQRVAQIIMQDMGMTTKILQMINSAFFGMHVSIADPAQAVSLLGMDAVASLVLVAQAFSKFRASSCENFSIEKLWAHSLATGRLARAIAVAEKSPPPMIEAAFTAGLLHDVGALALVEHCPRQYGEALRCAKDTGVCLSEVERRILGATHEAMGAYLLGLWGLADPIVEALAFHHDPSRCVGRTFSPLTAVHVANNLECDGCGIDSKKPSLRIDTDYLAELGLAERLPVWQELAKKPPTNGDTQ